MRVSCATVTLLGVVMVTGCGSTNTSAIKSADTSASPSSVKVANPNFSPAPGVYSTTQSVTISDSTAGAKIYYTTDGTIPTTSSQQYTGALSVVGSQVIQAVAVLSTQTPSAVVNADYAIVPPTVSTSTTFDFGQDLVNTVMTRTVATISNDAPTAAPVAIALSGDSSFTVVPDQSCSGQIAAKASCSIVVAYNPASSGVQHAAVNVQFTGGGAAPTTVGLTGTAAAIARGSVAPSNNPQVAVYSITSPFGATVAVQFGPTASYGFVTSPQATPEDGGAVKVLVAGMRANTQYHMQATVTFANGTTYQDVDHIFTTGSIPAGLIPPMTVTKTSGLTPQPGIEMVNTIVGSLTSGVYATDLSGNVIWTYFAPDLQPGLLLYPVKPMPNGDLIMEISLASQVIVNGPPPPGTLTVLREIDLAGNIVRQLSMAQLNSRLAAAGFAGLTLQLYSHDVTPLPNGHMLVMANMLRQFTDLPGYPGNTNVAGDVIVDLDQDWNPVWVWNEFDHFDVNRHPMAFPDWTHSNSVLYSKDDGNFLVSVRHQNWIVKVNYKDGLGDGKVLWKLGYQGDFTLKGGNDPQDWFYAEHNPAFFSANTSGVFSMGLMDNGDDRLFPDGTNCLFQGGADCYTTIPVMQIDENARTATLTSHQILPSSLYSSFAGDVAPLDNGNIEYNLAGVVPNSFIFEVTPTQNPETVWKMEIFGTMTYRAFRVPSLYPGVTWQ